jgi:hypothetical protein
MSPAVTQRGQRKRPADYTGTERQRLQAEHADELELKAKEMSMAAEVAAAQKTELVDYTKPWNEVDEVSPDVVLKEPQVTIRVIDKIEDMVFGREISAEGAVGPLKMYSFEPGTPYRVSRELAEHLESLGYLWAGK